MKIGLIVDHPKRDLPGALMIAHALAQKGVHTALIPLYDQAVDVPLLGLDALIVNYARPANLDLVQGYADMGLPVFVLDTEGGVLTERGGNAPEKLAEYVRTSGYANLLAGYFFWGNRLRQAFVDHSGMPADRLHVTGCPRFDFASPRWEETLQFERSAYVLVNANFPLVNPLFARSIEHESDALVQAGWERGYVDGIITDLRGILQGYLDTVDQLAARFPARSFLVRPHPFENAGLYQQRFAGRPNVVVDGRGSVLNVIRNAECVLHLNCGTSVEATMLRRLPISMEYLNTERMARHGPLPSRISWQAGDFEQLCAALEDLPRYTAEFDFATHYREWIYPWFHESDGAAADRVVEVILNYLGSSSRTPTVSLRRSLASSRKASRAGQRLQALFANLTGSAAAAQLRAKFQPVRREKRNDLPTAARLMQQLAQHAGTVPPSVHLARHPYTGARLATLLISPA